MRVGGINLKGTFTRTRQPKMAAYVLREFWVKGTDTVPDRSEEERGDV